MSKLEINKIPWTMSKLEINIWASWQEKNLYPTIHSGNKYRITIEDNDWRLFRMKKNNNGKFSDITQTRKKNSGKNQKKNVHQFHEIFAWFVRFKIYKLKFFFLNKNFCRVYWIGKKIGFRQLPCSIPVNRVNPLRYSWPVLWSESWISSPHPVSMPSAYQKHLHPVPPNNSR